MNVLEFISLPKEAVQVVFDALVQSMDAGSGFLEYKDWCALRQLAHYLGVDPDSIIATNEYSSGRPVNKHGYMVSPKWDSRRRVYAPWPDPTAPLTDEPTGVEDV